MIAMFNFLKKKEKTEEDIKIEEIRNYFLERETYKKKKNAPSKILNEKISEFDENNDIKGLISLFEYENLPVRNWVFLKLLNRVCNERVRNENNEIIIQAMMNFIKYESSTTVFHNIHLMKERNAKIFYEPFKEYFEFLKYFKDLSRYEIEELTKKYTKENFYDYVTIFPTFERVMEEFGDDEIRKYHSWHIG